MSTGDVDARATRKASRSIGVQIMVASAILVLGIVLLAIAFVIHQSEPSEQVDLELHSTSHVFVETTRLFQALIVIGIGAVGFAGLVSWFIARRAVRPLGHALKLQRDFVADASHELRTPLAVLDARIQVFERRLASAAPPNTAEAAATVADLRRDTRALVDIVNDLLLAAGGDDAETEPIAVAPVITAAVDSLRILATERNVTLVVEVDESVFVRIPAGGLRRCIVALVDNALAHSPSGTTVSISGSRGSDRLRISVIDRGAGIQGIAPERVFDRFAHSTPTEAHPTSATRPGFGIGLALVRDLAVRHGGELRVEQTSPEGTTMVLELPIAR